MVGLQPAQRIRSLFTDFITRNSPLLIWDWRIGHISVDLGGQHYLVAFSTPLRKPAPNYFFGTAVVARAAVHIRCIKEVDTQFQTAVHNTKGIFFRCAAAKEHGSQADFTDLH